MAFVCVDKDGTEWIFRHRPIRKSREWVSPNFINRLDADVIELPSGSIRKLIGRDLTWEDEPCELKED